MKNYYIAISLLISAIVVSCTDSVEKYDNWPEWKTQDPVTVAGEEMTETYYTNYVGKKRQLTQDAEVDFTGFEALEFALQPQFWEFKSDTKARFKGETGEYDLIYDATNELLYVEQTDKKFPDALYLIGANLGHAGAGKVISATWDSMHATPDNGMTCRRVSDKVFEISLYLGENFAFKLFKHHGWGTHEEIEIWAEDLTLDNPTLVQGTGDFVPGPLFQPGIYNLKIDMNANTFSMQPQNGQSADINFAVNGKEMGIMPGVASCLGVALELKTGDVLTFENFGDISEMIQPDFFENATKDQAAFRGMAGTYNLYYDLGNRLIYVENSQSDYSDALWTCGSGYGHPAAERVTVHGWQFNTGDSYQCVKVDEGVFETTLFLDNDFHLKFFKKRGDWGTGIGTQTLDPLPANLLDKHYQVDNLSSIGNGHFTGDLIPGKDFTPGVYRLRIDMNKGVIAAVNKMNEDDIKSLEFKVNGQLMQRSETPDFLEVELELTQGQEVAFEGFSYLQYMLQPEFFEWADGQYKFRAVSGTYRISYRSDRDFIYVERTDKTSYPDAMWLTGNGFGHPKTDGNVWEYLSVDNWGFATPGQYLCCAKTGEGIFETTFYFHAFWGAVSFYLAKDNWNRVFNSSEVEIVSLDGSFGRANGYEADGGNKENFGATKNNIDKQYGVYRLKWDMNTNTCTFTRL